MLVKHYGSIKYSLSLQNQNQSFIALKDHKENFQNNRKCRLINPVKTEIKIVSKHYIDKINKSIRENSNVNQWINTHAVITWFKNIKRKRSSYFIKFGIVDFYPSISTLLSKAINFAKPVTPIQVHWNYIVFLVKRFNRNFQENPWHAWIWWRVPSF